MRPARGKVLLAMLWCVLMGLNCLALYYEGRYQFGSGAPIGHLAKTSGVVQLRSKEVSIWSYAARHQNLYENDVLATGDDGYALLQFSDGRSLVLEPNTHVLVATTKEDNNSDFVVKLMSGSLSTAPKQQTPTAGKPGQPGNLRRLVVKVDDKEIKVHTAGTQLAVTKAADAAAVVKVASGKAEVADLSKLSNMNVTTTTKASLPVAPMTMTLAAKVLPVLSAPERVVAAAEVAAPAKESLSVVEPEPKLETTKSSASAKAEIEPEATSEPTPVLTPTPIPTPTPTPKPTPPPLPPLKAPEFGKSFSRMILWTLASFNSDAVPMLQVPLETEQERLTRSTVFGLQLEKNRDATVITSSKDQMGRTSQTVELSSSTLRRFAKIQAKNSLKLGRLRLRTAAVRGKETKLGRGEQTLMLGSIADQPSLPLTVHVDTLAIGKPSKGWLIADSTFQDNAALTIHLLPGLELTELVPLLAGANRFRIAATASSLKGQAFVVRDGQIIASIDLSDATPEKWDFVRKLLRADLIYAGSRAAFVQSGTSPGERRTAIRNSLKQSTVFMLNNDRLIGIETRLLRKNKMAMSLVDDMANAVFTESVTILSNRPKEN